jgi:hypothetical protein
VICDMSYAGHAPCKGLTTSGWMGICSHLLGVDPPIFLQMQLQSQQERTPKTPLPVVIAEDLLDIVFRTSLACDFGSIHSDSLQRHYLITT